MPRHPRKTSARPHTLQNTASYVLLRPPNMIARRALASLDVHEFISESTENRDLVLTEPEYNLIYFAVLAQNRVIYAKQSIQQLIDTAQVRDGALYVGTARVVSEKTASQALAALSFSLHPEETVQEAAARYRGLPEDLFRVWHASLLLLAVLKPVPATAAAACVPSASSSPIGSTSNSNTGSAHSQGLKAAASKSALSTLLPIIFGSA
ncbi:hypothetical protein CPB85DRAFT_481587 [Mucidula mucida]|nr:hypothetical protein CPB85DRAFT_481587 [Mucidula mucida]